MQFLSSGVSSQTTSHTSLSPVLLFTLAAGLLMVMSLALVPALVLPLVAFVAMALLTRLLGLRLYRDLTQASKRGR